MVVEKGVLFEEARPMSRIEGRNVAEESRRPPLTDAPEWFNRARARSSQRLIFQPVVYRPHPVPLPRTSAPERADGLGQWTRQQGILLYALCAAALPITFAMGFWTRGVVIPQIRETASDGVGGAPAAAEPGQHLVQSATREPISPPAVPAIEDVTARSEQHPGAAPREFAASEPPAPLRDQLPPELLPAHPERRRSGPPGKEELVIHDVHSWGVRAEPEKPSNTGDGFSLPTAGAVRHVSVEVVRPARAWFATATKEDECASGTCPAPVARLDRRLNTALEWSSTPEAAAQEAERGGKLVFLIHVSGNFAQPGFT
jgi:hypothetical protein